MGWAERLNTNPNKPARQGSTPVCVPRRELGPRNKGYLRGAKDESAFTYRGAMAWIIDSVGNKVRRRSR